MRPRGAAGFTVIEMVAVLSILALAGTLAARPLRRVRDRIAVRAAASDVATALAVARQRAVMRVARTTASIDARAGSVVVHTGADTALVRRVGAIHGVHLTATGTTVVYGPTGLGVGISNATIVARKGEAAETVVVSRLGRVRW